MSKNIISSPALTSSEIPLPPPDVLSGNGSNGLRNIHVDGEAAESFIAEKRIGERIKHLRLKKSMGLVELGRHTGLSASFLSQLETGRVVPTLRNLARIAMVFSKDLSYFFETEPHTIFRVHKQNDRVRLPQTGVDDPTYYFESLGYMVPDRHLDPYHAEFLPLKKTVDVRPHVHPGYEFLYMLGGDLEIRHADKVHVLEEGDSVYFDASTPHAYRCVSKGPATALIVTMHQQHIQQNAAQPRPAATTPAPHPAPPPAVSGLRQAAQQVPAGLRPTNGLAGSTR